MEIKEVLSYALDKLSSKGIDKAHGSISESEKKELNIEAGKISLLRTTFQNSIFLEGIKDSKQGSISINKISKTEVDESIEKLILLIESSQPDDANDIAEKQDKEKFTRGQLSADLNNMYDKLNSFNNYVKSNHKNIILEAGILDHVSSNAYVMNTNGVNFNINKGEYGFSPMFTAKKGSLTSSFNYTSYSSLNLNEEIKDRGYVIELMNQSYQQLYSKKLQNKFVGQVIVTPHCLSDFLSFIEGSISDGALISGTSIYKDKIGKKIANSKFTLSSLPVNSDVSCGYFLTSDGYKARNINIIEGGLLNTHLLSLYGSKKTGGRRISNDGGAYQINSSTNDLTNMIKDIDKGIILCRFSGGSPSDNGDFSGVAKNSFYIENGKIQFPITETMISGNIAQMFMNIIDISNETIDFGYNILPWISFDGITIS